MSILAVCPYCRAGRVRAPNKSIGASATCPNCNSCFTIVESSDIMPAPSKQPIPHPTTGIVAVIRAQGRKAPPQVKELDVPPVDDSTDSAEIEQSDESIDESAPRRPATIVADLEPPPDLNEAVQLSFVLAMIAIALAGIGLVASQLPYGRFVTVGFAVLGLLVGLFAFATADRRWQLPVTGLGLNAVTLILATLLPGWLGLSDWRPPVNIVDDSTLIKVMPYDGGQAQVAEDGWVDATKGTWQHGDLRVTLTAAWVGKVDLVHGKDKASIKDRSNAPKEKKLQISLRLANVGAARRLEYGSWNQTPPADASPVRLRQFSSKAQLPSQVLLPATFEKGWDVQGRGVKCTLFPGMTGDDLLIFEVPSSDADYLRLELPPWVFGNTDPPIESVRFHIPSSMIKFL
jgi:hypothetical protein